MTAPESTAVRCAGCHHSAAVTGDKSTWLCPCATTRPDCDCHHLNVVDTKE